MRLVFIAGLVVLPTHTFGYELQKPFRDMTVAEYSELGMFVRAEAMRQIVAETGIRHRNLNACLMVQDAYPNTREKRMMLAVKECVDYALEKLESE